MHEGATREREGKEGRFSPPATANVVGLSLAHCFAGCWTSQVTGDHVVALLGLRFLLLL